MAANPNTVLPSTQEIVKELFNLMKAEGYMVQAPVVPTLPTTTTGAPSGLGHNSSLGIQSLDIQRPGPAAATGSPANSATDIIPPHTSGHFLPLRSMDPLTMPATTPTMNINNPLSQVLSNFTGENGFETCHSISRPLDMHIDTKLKAKILAGEYIDFGLLLQKSSDSDHFKIQFHNNELALVPKQKSSQIKSVEQWLSAFHIFVSIYVQSHPQAISALMKYADTVQTLSRRSGIAAALNYDCNFRRWHQLFPQTSWGNVHSEFYLEATAIGLRSTSRPNSFQQPFQQPFHSKSTSWPKGVCWPFNKSGSCRKGPRCKFPHVCSNCGGGHSFRQCKLQSSSTLPQDNPSGGGNNGQLSATNPQRQQRKPPQKI
ncbi:uncharacterized protein LOC110442413 [Mizuhopecten yessoensis]|uniref:uncharacterized protein LOC110442413 n=1 Tax=Mizuhopecten yessoensis TaxID=6573 RepID=UPI000B45CD76|nr:uncharacterized protein LOC110442413 [Mizuhopecten yessoensis]